MKKPTLARLRETTQPQVIEDTFLRVLKAGTVAAISINFYCLPIRTSKGSSEEVLLVLQPIVIKK